MDGEPLGGGRGLLPCSNCHRALVGTSCIQHAGLSNETVIRYAERSTTHGLPPHLEAYSLSPDTKICYPPLNQLHSCLLGQVLGRHYMTPPSSRGPHLASSPPSSPGPWPRPSPPRPAPPASPRRRSAPTALAPLLHGSHICTREQQGVNATQAVKSILFIQPNNCTPVDYNGSKKQPLSTCMRGCSWES